MEQDDIKAIDGYEGLSDMHKALFEKFIVNFFNASGLERRATLVPKRICSVVDITYSIEYEDAGEDYFVASAGVVVACDKNGVTEVLDSWADDGYRGLEPDKVESESYLRFEYSCEGNDNWLHVVGEKEWY